MTESKESLPGPWEEIVPVILVELSDSLHSENIGFDLPAEIVSKVEKSDLLKGYNIFEARELVKKDDGRYVTDKGESAVVLSFDRMDNLPLTITVNVYSTPLSAVTWLIKIRSQKGKWKVAEKQIALVS